MWCRNENDVTDEIMEVASRMKVGRALSDYTIYLPTYTGFCKFSYLRNLFYPEIVSTISYR